MYERMGGSRGSSSAGRVGDRTVRSRGSIARGDDRATQQSVLALQDPHRCASRRLSLSVVRQDAVHVHLLLEGSERSLGDAMQTVQRERKIPLR